LYRFIGELFKLGMLTTNIMQRCIKDLLQEGDEESLECLCKLLTTIGKDLENKNQVCCCCTESELSFCLLLNYIQTIWLNPAGCPSCFSCFCFVFVDRPCMCVCVCVSVFVYVWSIMYGAVSAHFFFHHGTLYDLMHDIHRSYYCYHVQLEVRP